MLGRQQSSDVCKVCHYATLSDAITMTIAMTLCVLTSDLPYICRDEWKVYKCIAGRVGIERSTQLIKPYHLTFDAHSCVLAAYWYANGPRKRALTRSPVYLVYL